MNEQDNNVVYTDVNPVQPEAAPVQPEVAPVQPEAVPVQQETTPVQPEVTPAPVVEPVDEPVPVVEPAPAEGTAPEDAPKKGFMDVIKDNLKLIIIAAAAVVVIAVALIIVGNVATNTWKTPIKKYFATVTMTNPEKICYAQANGLGESEMKAIRKILHKSEEYMDDLEYAIEDNQDNIDWMKEEYGRNFKISYKIEDKSELSLSELKTYRDDFRRYIEWYYQDYVDDAEDFDSYDWADFAEDYDLSRGDAKKLISAMKKFSKKLGKAKVTKGYDVDILVTVKGKELDEPYEEDITITVIKINGRWFIAGSEYRAFELWP